MAVKYHTTVPAQHIDEELRRSGRCRVRLPGTIIEFEITHHGVEVVVEGTRYVMHQERDFERDGIVFFVTIDQRWVCRASQYGYDGTSTFEVLDKAGDPFEHRNDAYWEKEYTAAFQMPLLASPDDKRKKVLLLC